MQIIVLPLAEFDLDSIYDYYALKSINAAVKIYNSILDEMGVLSKFPNIGIIEPSLVGEEKLFRSLVVVKGKFKIIYFTEGDFLYITHIWNCRSNPTKLKIRH